MKILSLFCDMIRPSILDFSKSSDSFEKLLMSMGGTYYTNCFSPGPDTGRSMGCFWSGLTPQDNGCNTRARYPKFYLKGDSFLDDLSSLGFHLYFFTNPNEKILGCLPSGFDTKGNHNSDLNFAKFVKTIDVEEENIFVHLALTDFHWALDDYGANRYGVYQGLRIIKESITKLFDIIDVDVFDYVFVYSDHGFKFDEEFKSQDKIFLLNRDRSNVMMFIHKKGDCGFSTNSKLCSLIDVYPTIMEIIGKEYSGYANSLFSNSEHDYIICDEHGSFLPEVNQKIEYWAVVKKERIYLRSYYDYKCDDGEDFDIDKDEFDNFLSKNSKSFSDVHSQLQILELYKTMATEKSVYSNGENRLIINQRDYLKRLRNKVNKIIWYLKNKKD